MNGVILALSLTLGQWAPEAEQARLKSIWDKSGVDFPAGAKFYDLPRVSQRLVTVNGVVANGIYDTSYRGFPEAGENINRQLPWKTPAGLHWSPREQWSKATLAYFPPGESVLVWRETTQVLNSFGSHQPQLRISWAFPPGTLFAEMLIRRHEGKEWAFEIRERVKHGRKWESGTTYRPFASAADLPKGAVYQKMSVPAGKLADFGIGSRDVVTWELPKLTKTYKLTASRLTASATHDEAFVPKGYMGTFGECVLCHGKAGESTSYGATNIPGSDSILSWHPFTMDTLNSDRHPQLDQRWPLRNHR